MAPSRARTLRHWLRVVLALASAACGGAAASSSPPKSKPASAAPAAPAAEPQAAAPAAEPGSQVAGDPAAPTSNVPAGTEAAASPASSTGSVAGPSPAPSNGGAPSAATGGSSPSAAAAPTNRTPTAKPGAPTVVDGADIPRSALLAVLSGGVGRFLQRVQLEPALDKGRFVGWRLVKLFDDAQSGSGALRPGDTLLRVNGQSIERPEQFKNVWDSLATESQLVLQVERAGQRSEIHHKIVQ